MKEARPGVRAFALGLAGTRSHALHPPLPRHQPFGSPALHHSSQPSVTPTTPKAPEPMPLPSRGGEPRLTGARVVRTSLPRATPRSPRSVGRGAPLLSHAQRLTRRRHSSEQAPLEPEQADFRSGKWLQERAGGDAKDPQHTPAAGMSSREGQSWRPHWAGPLAAAAAWRVQSWRASRSQGCCLRTQSLPRTAVYLEQTASQPSGSGRHRDAIGRGLGLGLRRGRL